MANFCRECRYYPNKDGCPHKGDGEPDPNWDCESWKPHPAASEWMPIADAPRDGTELLLFGAGVFIGKWGEFWNGEYCWLDKDRNKRLPTHFCIIYPPEPAPEVKP